jgi:hypothetical protein
VGSPTTDPLRRYPPGTLAAPSGSGSTALRQGLRVVPLQSTSPSKGALNRRHSIGGSPTSQRNPNFPPPSSPSSKHHSARFQSPSMRTTSLPPQTSSPIPISGGGVASGGFVQPPSPSPSPSPPTYHQDVAAHYARSASAPMSIPRPPSRGGNAPGPVHTSSSSGGAHSHRERSLSSGDQPSNPFSVNALSGSPSQSAPLRSQFTRTKSERMSGSRGDLPGSATPPLPRLWTASSPPKWQPSSAPTGPSFPESWGPGTRPSTPGARMQSKLKTGSLRLQLVVDPLSRTEKPRKPSVEQPALQAQGVMRLVTRGQLQVSGRSLQSIG